MMTMSNASPLQDTNANPLLETQLIPAFDRIRPEHVTPAIDELLAAANAALDRATLSSTPADYETLSAILDVASERLECAWGAVGHLNSVADTPELRAAYNDNLPKVTEFYTRLGADERLYAKYKAIAQGDSAAALSAPRKQALTNALRNFVLSGAELQGEAKTRFAAIQERQSALSQAFSEHVLDATDQWYLDVPASRLTGLPEDVLQATRALAEKAGVQGHRVTLHAPCYVPVMQYAQDRDLRETLYRAYTTRASEQGPKERDNGPLMQEILALRQEEAKLLGYAHFGDVSLVAKMADSPVQITQFLHDLAMRARPFAEKDLAELRAFAAENLNLPAADLRAWDVSYASEKLKEARYAFSDTEVKQYFTEPKVLDGLFDIVQTLFEVTIRPDVAPVWNDTVRFFRIERGNQLIGQFYLDLYARPGKRPGAWMSDVRSRWLRPDGGLQTPVAHLTCNFAPPVGDKPALLTHDEVTTLFHEFGHGLHHMLTRIEDLGVSGISGVEWDAVELPSQFMENFCWEWDVVKQMTAHVGTGEPLPRALFDKMLAAKNFQSGLMTLRQIEFSLFDMRIHTEPGCETQNDGIQKILDEVRSEVLVLPPPTFNRFQHSFSHIFAGGYAAGYYSYKWAEVLSSDAYAAFEESGILNPETGRRYREAILEAGGSRSAMESFTAFRGREPQIDALLRHQGMV
jgi:oligopeptidase A